MTELFKSSEFTQNMVKYLRTYYSGIHIPRQDEGITDDIAFAYMDYMETINQEDKTRKLRDIIIPSILGEVSNDEVNNQLEELNNKIVVGDDDTYGKVSMTLKREIIPTEVLSFNIRAIDEVDVNRVIELVINEIDNKVDKLISNVRGTVVGNEIELRRELYKVKSKYMRSGILMYSSDEYLNQMNIGYGITSLKGLKPGELLIVPKNKPIVLCIQDVFFVEQFGLYDLEYKIYVRMNLGLVSGVNECSIIKLDNNFKFI